MKIPGLDMTTGIIGEIVERPRRQVVFAPIAAPGKEVRRCPLCAAPLRASRVNVSRCTAIGGPWKTILLCTQRSCRHSELSTLSLEDIKNGHNHP